MIQTRIILTLLLASPLALRAEDRPASEPAKRPAASKQLPHLQIDLKKKQVRMECEAISAEDKLEFLVCATGTKEYESVLRSSAKPSHLHLALLLIGLDPGEPVHFSEPDNKWLPPHGPALKLSCEFLKDGKLVSVPANRLMRDVKSKKEMPPIQWVFVGSRLMQTGEYASDTTGYLVTLVNFEHTVIDVPDLKSNKNETLEWEINPDVIPKRNTTVWLVIAPADSDQAGK